VFRTTDAGASWTDITGNLPQLGAGDFQTTEFVAGAPKDLLLVGTNAGVFVSFSTSGFTSWEKLGTGLPNAVVWDLDYDVADDVLLAGTLGRGAWTISNLRQLTLLTADLAISKTATPNPVTAGSNLTYAITITNNGPDAAESVTVTDILPEAFTFISCDATGGGVCSGAENNRVVTFASLAPGASASITIVVKAKCSVANGAIVNNTATISSATFDSNQSNNTATTATTVSNPPELITLQDDETGDVLQFNTLTGVYTFSSCTGPTLSGHGEIIRIGCRVVLISIRPGRIVVASVDKCQNKGAATVLSQGRLFVIRDDDTTNNACACASSAP